ncbi:NADPH-dependent F420 reductase [Mesorhizobium sp. A556]
MNERPLIGIIGGTGDLGSGLALRWAQAGYRVVVGSRSAEKAEAFAKEANAVNGTSIEGVANADAAAMADIVVIAVPFSSHDQTLEEIKGVVEGKIVVDAAVPLMPPKVATVQLPAEGSAAVIAARILGSGVKVVSGFHNVGASKLHAGKPVGCDVLIFGDDKEAKQAVVPLAEAIGSRGIDGGVLANSAAAEAMTSILIGINRRYKVDGAGIKITGLG